VTGGIGPPSRATRRKSLVRNASCTAAFRSASRQRFPTGDVQRGSHRPARPIRMATCQREARDWPISYDDLEPYYCQAERKLVGINGTRANQLKKRASTTIRRRWTRIRSATSSSGHGCAGHAALSERHWPSFTRIHAPVDEGGDPKTAFVNRYGDPSGQVEYLGLTPHTCQHAANFECGRIASSRTGDKRITCQ